MADAGGVLVFLFERHQPAEFEGVITVLPRKVVGQCVVDVLDAKQLVGAEQPEAGDVDDRDDVVGILRKDFRNRDAEAVRVLRTPSGVADPIRLLLN